MLIQLFRKTDKSGLTKVGLSLNSDWDRATSDGHGRFSVTNLTAGEYSICVKMPYESEDASSRICLGNTFRMKDAQIVKVKAGETASGADIEIPLTGLHAVAGTVSALADGHGLKDATVRLLYADDREKAREARTSEDGIFSFPYVPEDKYIIQVSGAKDAAQENPEDSSGNTGAVTSKPIAARSYADKEMPVTVMGEVDDLQIQLVVAPPDKTKGP
jgi:hypothetical protein